MLLHLWWNKRFRQLQHANLKREEENTRLQEERTRSAAQAEAQQQALFNSMVEGVLLVDANGRIQLANQALKRLMGATQEIRGQTILEAFRLHELADLVQRVSSEGEVLGFEFELPGADPRTLQINAAAITDKEKRRQGVIVVLHDLTRLKQLENTRKEFVANVSHELRTPLSLIKGFVETLIDGAKDDPAVTARFLETILKHTNRLTFLIEDLLTISQLESGRSVLNLQPVELRPLVDRVLEDLQSRAAEKKATLKNDVSAGLVVNADADRLQQVLVNLMDNAVKHGHDRGLVTVSARLDEEKRVEVCVQDNGPGIPTEALGRVFERFYRVDRARAREQGGTGLGLSIVKHIVQSHSGEVWAQSQLGQGSSFYFTLAAAHNDLRRGTEPEGLISNP
jgi:two-component system phosphate regulon sensor histidine kinase PhoR